MDVLRDEGQQGWELTSLGLGTLHFRRKPGASTPWEYLRNSGHLSDDALKELAAQGWQYTASWLLNSYNYFKRPVKSA